MKISIRQSKTIHELQVEFQQIFPFLKLEFYKESHTEGEASSLKNQLNHQLTLGEIAPSLQEGDIVIRPEMKVVEVETAFTAQFGLFAQIFRKSGQVWLQTIRTDDWTLAEQNSEAEQFHRSTQTPEQTDYREQE